MPLHRHRSCIEPHRIYAQLLDGRSVRPTLLAKRKMHFRRTVRITFDRAQDLFRVVELIGDWAVCSVTDWTCEEDAEIEAAFYAAARGLSVSRVDL
jgi:hypothetical protein